MRKAVLFIVLILLTCSLFAQIRWATKKEVEQKNKELSESDYKVSAMAFCDTIEEVKKVTKTRNLDIYFTYVYTLDEDKIPEKDEYIVGFMEDCIVVVGRKTEGIAECYKIIK